MEQKGHKFDALEILEMARVKIGKALFNEELDFNVSPLLKLAIDYNWNKLFIPK